MADAKAELERLNAQLKENAESLQKLQQTTTPTVSAAPEARPVGKEWWRADEAMTISAVVLIYGIVVMILATIVLRRTNIHPDSVLRLFGTIIIVVGALFLIVAGYSDTQMGPVMGLLGTIAGYLLGKNDKVAEKPEVK